MDAHNTGAGDNGQKSTASSQEWAQEVKVVSCRALVRLSSLIVIEVNLSILFTWKPLPDFMSVNCWQKKYDQRMNKLYLCC